MSSNNPQPSSRRTNRGGRNQSNGNWRGGGGRYRGSNNNSNRRQRGSNSNRSSQQSSEQQDEITGMRDEEVLIAFMPYLKGSHTDASRIHEEYQSTNDERAFLRSARDLLRRERNASSSAAPAAAISPPPPAPPPAPQQKERQHHPTNPGDIPDSSSSSYPNSIATPSIISSTVLSSSTTPPHQSPVTQSVDSSFLFSGSVSTSNATTPASSILPSQQQQEQQQLPVQKPAPHALLFPGATAPSDSMALPSMFPGAQIAASNAEDMDPSGAVLKLASAQTSACSSPLRPSPVSPPQHPQPQLQPLTLPSSCQPIQQPQPPLGVIPPPSAHQHLLLPRQQDSPAQWTDGLQMHSLEKGLNALLQDDPIVPTPARGGPRWTSPMQPPRGLPSSSETTSHGLSSLAALQATQQSQIVGPPRASGVPGQKQLSPSNSSHGAVGPGGAPPRASAAPGERQMSPNSSSHGAVGSSAALKQHSTWGEPGQPSPFQLQHQAPAAASASGLISLTTPPQPLNPVQQSSPVSLAVAPPAKGLPTEQAEDVSCVSPQTPGQQRTHEQQQPPTSTKKEAPQPKRIWTNFREQPGQISVSGFTGNDSSNVLTFRPRQELTALWSLPLQYVLQYRLEQEGNAVGADTSPHELLRGLTVGLFRRGCAENGSQASIISKGVVGDFQQSRAYDCWKDDSNGNCILRGKVPFYSPRTPGHVLFRLYWDDDPYYTLAAGPALHVRVLEQDFESSIRFVLSNFKGKRSNPTSLSSLHSLAVVLETFLSRPNESAARAAWGCVQEARKVIEACAVEYSKTTAKLGELEDAVEELKERVERQRLQEEEQYDKDSEDAAPGGNETGNSQQPEKAFPDDPAVGSTNDETEGNGDNSLAAALSAELRDKNRSLMGGRASCERKWRDAQLAFAAILKAVVTNPSMTIVLRRDLLTKMRIEFELWCPLVEEFAIPGGDEPQHNLNGPPQLWYEPLRNLPSTITANDFASFTSARVKMQLQTLGFDPNTYSLEDILFPPSAARSKNNSRGGRGALMMDPRVVSVLNNMSAAMGRYYQEFHKDEESIARVREEIRARTERCVVDCGAFPAGTTVTIFGSAANGFGSPKSDIDMCLTTPGVHDRDEESGPAAMAKLAEFLEKAGMKDVDTARLTARIPIIRYYCPNPMSLSNGTNEKGENDEDSNDLWIECDLSMHNPLAVLNTSMLRAYSDITPVTRVLASVIKRWAKARDINNPAGHTLSSYGYVLMLLHFLTYHYRTETGLVAPVAPPEGLPKHMQPNQQRHRGHSQSQKHHQQPLLKPLLPNLQWMDPMWPNFSQKTPYRELSSPGNVKMAHPIEKGQTVNAYFYRPSTPNDKAVLQMLFPGQDLSLAILLASFFRYYAYEFDYKRHVVSLHSTAVRGMVEREVKAELDGWRNYSAALTIEDPFETAYDVAHVIKRGYYHRIRREFALAYSKIADVASRRQPQGGWGNRDLSNMSGQELIDWICEPVSSPIE